MTFRFILTHPVLALEEHLAGATASQPDENGDSETGDPTIPLVYTNLGRELYVPQERRRKALSESRAQVDIE